MRERLRRLSVGDPLHVVQGSALELPFDEGTFDDVYSIGCLHHTGDLVRAVSEVRRVLRPDGRAVVMLYNRHSLRLVVKAGARRSGGSVGMVTARPTNASVASTTATRPVRPRHIPISSLAQRRVVSFGRSRRSRSTLGTSTQSRSISRKSRRRWRGSSVTTRSTSRARCSWAISTASSVKICTSGPSADRSLTVHEQADSKLRRTSGRPGRETMCGIGAILQLDETRVPGLDLRLTVINRLLEHRGPDGEGRWLHPAGHVGFAHRRLEIIDLSPATSRCATTAALDHVQRRDLQLPRAAAGARGLRVPDRHRHRGALQAYGMGASLSRA